MPAETPETPFSQIWNLLFTTPVHLDSALSKLKPQHKAILAQLLPQILLKPASIAEAVGVGVIEGEPWSLTPEALSRWRPAELMAERLHQNLIQGGVKTSAMREDFPPSMLKEWESDWGAEITEYLVKALGSEAPLTMRASRKTTASQLLRALQNEKAVPVKAEVSSLSPQAVRLSGFAKVMGTAAFERGEFEIQDEGSQIMSLFALFPELMAPLLAKRPGEVIAPTSVPKLPSDPPALTVVDACAGAGGKTLAMADALLGKGRVYAYDIGVKKLQALRRRAARAGLTNVQAVDVKEGAEAEVVSKFRRRAQVVLVDAPCSGWGVLRRNPDAKWRQDEATKERMPKIQARLLDLYSDLVAPGGRLVYGVCTFRPQETVAIIEEFVRAHPEFSAREGGYLGPGPMDGFFMQSLVRAPKGGSA